MVRVRHKLVGCLHAESTRKWCHVSEERRLAVLRAIVEDFVRTRDPVGSKAIGERYNLGVSPATIRNDMAALEEEGLIAQPHTSAGRVPTDAGYRAFVDRIANIKPLSAAERRAIATLIAQPVDIDAVVEQTVRALAQLTRQVALVQYPSVSTDRVRHVDIVPLTSARLLVVVITESGRVEQRPVVLNEDCDDVFLSTVRTAISEHLIGQRLHDASTALASVPAAIDPASRASLEPVIAAVSDALGHGMEDRIVMAGTANLTNEAVDAGSLGPILEILEEQVVLLRLVSDMADDPEKGVSVKIGSENDHEGLTSSSVVSASYGTGDKLPRLAVLGPTRMDYPTTMAAVRAVAKYVSRIITPYDGDKP